MSLERFKEEVKGRGLAKTNRFVVEFGLPQLVQKDMFNLEVVQLFCDSASIPGLNIATQPNRSFGEQREIPYDRNFEPITLNFYVDSRMVVKDFFDSWISSVINPKSRTINYYDEYTTDILISVLDNQDQQTYTIGMYEAYPKSIQAISLDNNNRDAMKIAVTFNYKYHLTVRLDVLDGDTALYDTFNINKRLPLNNEIPANYFNAGSQWATSVPSEYLQNTISYNEQYADQLSIANALSQIQSQGIQTGLGSLFS